MVQNSIKQQLSSRFQLAQDKTYQWHKFQIRKGSGTPYIAHLMSVCAIALEYGADEDIAIAALLHDAVEDVEFVTIDTIENEFGKSVADIVSMCSDTENTCNKPPWRSRKEKYIEHLKTAPPEVLLVSLADKLHNLTSLYYDFKIYGDKLWSFFNASKEEILWYYSKLKIIFTQRNEHLELVKRFSTLHEQFDKLINK